MSVKGENPGFRREQVVRFEQTTLRVPVRYPNGESKYAIGYTGLGLRRNATLDDRNLKAICIKIAFTAIRMEAGTY